MVSYFFSSRCILRSSACRAVLRLSLIHILFASINGQIVSVPVEPENPLRTAEMTLEDDYGMIDGIINNGRRGEELEKAQAEARRTTPEKKPSIRERLEDAKRECAERKSPDKPAPQKKPPELGDL